MATIKEYLDYSELAQAVYGNFIIGTPSIEELMNDDRAKFTQNQAQTFAERYKVLAVSSDSNGFSATLFAEVDENNNLTGKKILAIRGTDGLLYDADDDLWDGLAAGVVPEQYESLVSFFEELKSSGKVTASDRLVVTGHSLGGALAQMTTATYPDYADQTYTYNAPGAKSLNIPPLVEENGKKKRGQATLKN